MSKHKMMVEVEIDLHNENKPGEFKIPGFHNEYAELDAEAGAPIAEGAPVLNKLGISAVAPTIFYLFGDDKRVDNHGFIATINLFPALNDVINRYEELFPKVVDKDKTE